jgi:hypothetical protein
MLTDASEWSARGETMTTGNPLRLCRESDVRPARARPGVHDLHRSVEKGSGSMSKSYCSSSYRVGPSSAVSKFLERLNRFRMPLIVAGMFLLTLMISTSAMAADAAASEEKPPQESVTHLILAHWADPIFLLICVLSIWGLTLIIQGFIKNRASVLMPEETTNQIRDMISQRKFKELI